MKNINCLRLWDEGLHMSYDVDIGDMMIFRHDIIHKGVENTYTHNRDVLFLLYTKEEYDKSISPDDYQVYVWTWLRGILDNDSDPRFLASVIEHVQHNPIGHLEVEVHKNIRQMIKDIAKTV